MMKHYLVTWVLADAVYMSDDNRNADYHGKDIVYARFASHAVRIVKAARPNATKVEGKLLRGCA